MLSSSSTPEQRLQELGPYFAQYEIDLEKQTQNGPHELTEQHRSLNREVLRMLFARGVVELPLKDCNKVSDADLIMRFLIARKFDCHLVVENIESYIRWRVEEKIDEVLWETEFDPALSVVGPVYAGFTAAGLPIGWQKPDPQKIGALLDEPDKYPIEAIMRKNWHSLEAARRLMLSSGADRMVQVLDLSELGIGILGRPSVISLLKEISKRTQGKYPELLLRMYVLNGGMIFSAAWGAIKPLLDERVQKKVQPTDDLTEFISVATIPKSFGGEAADDAPLHCCLAEAVEGKVPRGTPPLRPEGYRGDFVPEEAQQRQGGGDDDDDNDFDDEMQREGSLESLVAAGGGNAVAAEGDDLESCDSGDLEQPDVMVSSPPRNPPAGGESGGGGVVINFRAAAAAAAASGRQSSLPRHDSGSRKSRVSPSRAANHPPATSNLSGSAAAFLSSMLKSPPSCIHLFIRLKNHAAFQMEPRITSRIDDQTRGSSGSSQQRMHQYSELTSLERGPNFYVIGGKILQHQKVTSAGSKAASVAAAAAAPVAPGSPSFRPAASGTAAPPPQMVAQLHVESGGGIVALRKHILVVDEKKKLHFILQRGALRNEVRVMRPVSDLLPEVEEVKGVRFRGPAERRIIARIMVPQAKPSFENSAAVAASQSACGRGGWICLQEQDPAHHQQQEQHHGQHELVMARCHEFPISGKSQQQREVAGQLFQLPPDAKYERGALQRHNGSAVAFHRHVAFFHEEFLHAGEQVLAAFCAGVDALFLDDAKQ